MATTPIKDVGSVMNLQAAMSNMAAGAAKNAGDSFQSVLNNQTGAGKQDVTKSQPVKNADNKAKPGDDLRAKEHARKDVRAQKPQEELSKEDLEKAAEVVAAAANELIGQIADTFDVPVEELQELMVQMDLEPADLLNPENLNAFLLQAGGVEDSMALLTNEEMYGDFQMLMDQAGELADSVAGELAALPDRTFAADVEAEPVDAADMEAEPEEEEPMPDMTGKADRAEFGEQPGQVRTPKAEEHKPDAGTNAGHAKPERDGVKHDAHAGEGNLVLQTIRNEEFAPELEAVPMSAGSEVDTQDIMRQIMDYMRVQIRLDETSMEMQLHPASLGTLQIQVEAKGGVLTANFITQNEAVKAALESQMVQLQENLEQQGLKVEEIEVTVATHQFEQNLDQQGRDGEQSGEAQEARRPRVRRLHLGGPDEMIPPEEMTEEDRITAEMMAANGGTVDYTA
ncbi:MAG: flagellar hook-length control protein FliK [Lachnospiraceae bacterium]|nr:flagellar hook-length control protein FliK [Lachnospiraceae bacterium]